jgi:multidrug efflux pump
MVSGTVLALVFVPVFFVFVLEWQRRIAGPRGSAGRPPPAADTGT